MKQSDVISNELPAITKIKRTYSPAGHLINENYLSVKAKTVEKAKKIFKEISLD